MPRRNAPRASLRTVRLPRTLACMAFPMIQIEDSPEDVLKNHVHSYTTTNADPLAQVVAPGFNGLISDWKGANETRIQLVTALAQAQANAIYLDAQLDHLVDLLVIALDKLTNKDRTDGLWLTYFKGRDPSEVKRPILKQQLATQALWLNSLQASPHQELKDIGAALAPLIPTCQAAEGALASAKQALVELKTIGAWAQHVEKSNSARADAYGKLLVIPSQNPALRLPSDYQETFFLHDTSRRGANKPKSSQEIKEEMKAIQDQLDQLTKDLADAEKREADEAKAADDLAKKAAELAALKQQNKDNKAKEKALTKELGKKKKK